MDKTLTRLIKVKGRGLKSGKLETKKEKEKCYKHHINIMDH